MARAPAKPTEKKKKVHENVKCYSCRHAVLQQWDNNPVVAYCNVRKVREVANTVRRCESYKENKETPAVMHLTRFVKE